MPSLLQAQMILTAVALHAMNAMLVGLVHIQDRITAASTLSQVPSIYLASFTSQEHCASRQRCFNPNGSTGTPNSQV